MSEQPSPGGASPARLAVRAAARIVGGLCVIGSLLFVSAGRTDWPRGWLFLALVAMSAGVSLPVILLNNPGFLRMRLHAPRPSRPFDKVFFTLSPLATAAMFLVAGLEAGRFGAPPLPGTALFAGLALHVAGVFTLAWALAVNPFLEPTVRIQTERAHRVIASGPYRAVRHPMYLGMVVMFAGWPLVLGSLWMYAPVAVLMALVHCRTRMEDRVLREELPGYEDYARRTPHRFIPFVW